MSEHLDEDFKKWPEDPFKLLNVDENSDKKTIRRAYNRLIKKFKPDHNPDEFRLIRTAYETALNHIEYSSFFFVNEEENSVEIQLPEENKKPSLTEDKNETETYWDLACDGKYLEAFRGLKERADVNYEPDAVLRLYWLKRLSRDLPDLDLLEILCSSYEKYLNYRISTIIFKEMELHAEWTLSQSCIRFIENVCRENVENVRQILEKRWQIAFEKNELEVISKDLERLRGFFSLKEEEWGLILLSAHNYLSFWEGEGAEQIIVNYHKEVNELPVNVGGFLDSALDSYDFLREVRRIVRHDQNGFIDANWRKIFAAYWAGCEKKYRKQLNDIILNWVKKPETALFLFDGMNTKTKPIVISQVKKIVSNFAYILNSEIYLKDEEKVSSRIKGYVAGHNNRGYFSERKSLLQFCLYQNVPPEDIVDYVMGNELEGMYWVQAINKDIHSAVYLAYKALMHTIEVNSD